MVWDERFARADGYLFGTAPAIFVAQRAAALMPPGARVLCLGDGEGRNSTHLAALGHRVTAMDASSVGLAKAQALAAAQGVRVDHVLADIAAWDWQPHAWDAVLGVFIQFAAPPLRAAIHAGIAQTLRPGGLVLLHGYAPRQVGYGTGGPRAVENLYRLEALADDFAGWPVLHSADYDAEIDEGAGHSGLSALVDFIARKPGADA